MTSIENLTTLSAVTPDSGRLSANGAAVPTRRRSGLDVDEITIVVPTRNESGNVTPLLTALSIALRDLSVTVVFVDDSDDDTPTKVVEQAATRSNDRFAIKLIARAPAERTGGLSGAVIAGLAAARTRWVCVMDGDLQHPATYIPRMLARAGTDSCELVAASRYTGDGSNDGLSGDLRKFVSRVSGHAARSIFARQLAAVSDPMTGFFLVDRSKLDLALLRPQGFKILLEILVSHPDLAVGEVPFVFANRHDGTSKANASHGVEFVRQIVALRLGATHRLMWRYDIHQLVGIASDRELPELEKFLVKRVPTDIPIITVRVGDLRKLPTGESIDLTRSAPTVNYRERTGFAMSMELGESRTDITVSRFLARSPHVMYTNVVEPVLRWKLVELGVALVHAACVSDDGHAYLVTARTDTGKTTTMLKVLDQADMAFLSDDLVIMSPDGTVRTFPKPLTISHHTVHALRNTTLHLWERIALVPQSRVHSRQGRLFAFLLTKYRLPVASINAIIQRLVPPPKFHVERLVRGVRSADSARMRGMFIIQRGGTGEQTVPTDEALEILLANCEDAFGFPPYSSLERLLLATADDDLRSRERMIIAEALGRFPVMAMQSDTLDWAERIPRTVDAWKAAGGNAPSPELALPRA